MSGENWRTWRQIVQGWRQAYPFMPPQGIKGKYDPTRIRAAKPKCKKCKSTWKVRRHHKGHEFYFALILEEAYAPRYIQFLPQDVVLLCGRCHERIHRIYIPILDELKDYVWSCMEGNHKPRYDVLESFRKRMISKCDRWLKNPIRKPSSGAKRRINKADGNWRRRGPNPFDRLKQQKLIFTE